MMANLTLLCNTILYRIIIDAASIYDINGTEAGCMVTGVINLNLSKDNFMLFPYPFDDKLTLASMGNEECEITLFDVTSRKLLHHSFVNSVSLNTAPLAKGVYLYEGEE